MSHRNFGIMSGRASLSGGSSTGTSASSAKQYYRADSNSFQSVLPDLRGGETASSFIENDDRELAAWVFCGLFAGCIVGLVCLSVMFFG